MATISEQIQQLIGIVREQGIEPNRIRMSPKTYQALSAEMMNVALDSEAARSYRGNVVWKMDTEIHGLRIEVVNDCPPDNIYVDHTDEEIEEQRRKTGGA